MKKITVLASFVIAITLFLVNWGHTTSMKSLLGNIGSQIEALTAPEYIHKMKPKITVFTAQSYDGSYSNGIKYGEYSEEEYASLSISNIDSPWVFIFYDCVGAIFNYKVCDINRVGWQNPSNNI